MNEQIEYFKRFASCYLKWSHSNMDRIVADAIRRDKETEEERKKVLEQEKFKNSTYGKLIAVMNESMKNYTNKYAEEVMKDNIFMSGTQWHKDAKIGTTLKIRLPENYHTS